VYLLHFSVVLSLQNYIYEPVTFEGALLSILVFWAITFIVSTIVYNYYEKPCTKLRERWKRKKGKAISF
jgi:peptidoglycan/LPS O-acetylase OafA/YrhL